MIKGKVNPISCNEGTDGELRYCATLFLTLALGGMCWIHSDGVLYKKWTTGKSVRLDTLKYDAFVLFIKNSCCSHVILVISVDIC